MAPVYGMLDGDHVQIRAASKSPITALIFSPPSSEPFEIIEGRSDNRTSPGDLGLGLMATVDVLLPT